MDYAISGLSGDHKKSKKGIEKSRYIFLEYIGITSLIKIPNFESASRLSIFAKNCSES